jgi:copper chaperone NosL
MILRLLIVIAFLLIGCSKEDSAKTFPITLTKDHACKICGMISAEYPGPKAQIQYKKGESETFCGTPHMFMATLHPERPRNISAIYVHDMGQADWDHPKNEWIDAKEAYYVLGGDKKGPMGDPLVPFSALEGAESYVKEHGGRIVRFDEITVDMLSPTKQDSPKPSPPQHDHSS